MILWTIQPTEVYDLIKETGVYRCDIEKTDVPFWKSQYNFMVKQMKKRIGNPPNGVTYPVWARYKWYGIRKKPDLRKERFICGKAGDEFVCMEIEIPDKDVLLSDFDSWGMILNNSLVSYTEEEDKKLEKIYKELPPSAKKEFKRRNWERTFDISPLNNNWTVRGETIQATFWELKREQIINVRFFKSKTRKEK